MLPTPATFTLLRLIGSRCKKAGQMILYLSSLRPNLILAADTIYDPRLLDSFCQVIKTALSESWADDSSNEGIGSEQPYALMATCVRNETTHSLFLEAAGK
jgi:hypothetical protein